MSESTGEMRRRLAAGCVVAAAAVVLTACGSVTAPAQLDAQFLGAVGAQGRTVPAGPDAGTTLAAAARTVCGRRRTHPTVAQRRDTAPAPRELASAAAAFAGDPQRVAELALKIYCPS